MMYRVIALISALSFVNISANQSAINGAENFEGTVQFGVDYSGQGVSAFKSMLPNTYLYSFLQGDFMFRLEGGMASAMMGDVVYKLKEDQTYMLMHSEKKAYTIDKPAEADKPVVKIEAMDVQETIAGYVCDKYMVNITIDGEASTQYVWATKQLSLKNYKKGGSYGSAGSLFASGVDGFPLKIKLSRNIMGMSIGIEMTAQSVDLTKPSSDLFVIPENYKVEAMDPKKMGF